MAVKMKMEPLGVFFELQWKNNSEEVAHIGIWDTPDVSLDWKSFKSYVCQTLGSTEDIHVAYVDSEGDELPIESECEFQEAVKFAKQMTSKGKAVVLKVEKNGIPLRGNQTALNIKKNGSFSKMMVDPQKNAKPQEWEVHLELPEVPERCTTKVRSSFVLAPQAMPLPHHAEEKKIKVKKPVLFSDSSKLNSGTVENNSKKDDLKKKAKPEKEECPPVWFKKYMQKMKKEIIAEVTTAVTSNTKQMLELAKASNSNTGCCSCGGAKGEVSIGTKNKKKSSDEDSSDGNLSNDQRDHKLLKKIEKLQKREKKLEKKLDSKLEKLENKTKRRMEKKSQSKARSEPLCEKKQCNGSKKRSGDGPVGTYLMDAILLSNGPKPTSEMHIKLGEKFTKVWTIMNNGILPWTDKTELRLAWGTLGLEPEETVVKCPILEPGEKGQIAVNFRAPEIPGTFESYWHFYHMGDRFGHWLGCAVVVDPKEPEHSKKNVMFVSSPPASYSLIDGAVAEDVGEHLVDKEKAVDLTVKAKPELVDTVPVEAKNGKSGKVSNESSEDKNANVNESVSYSIQKDPEYYSDSDDNLSVISGTISLSSNSEEEEENFVVVPLPACFICEVPLESADAQTNSEKLTTDLETNKDSDANQSIENSQKEPNPNVEEATAAPTLEQEGEAEVCFSTDTSNTCAHSSEKLDIEHLQRANIYAVDLRGHCVPVEEAYKPKQQQCEKRNNTGKHYESNSSPNKENETKHTFCSWQKFGSNGNAETFCTGIPDSNRFYFHTATSPPPQNENGAHCHYFTASSAHSSSSSSSASSTQNDNATSSQTNSNTSPQDKTDQHVGASVHILPEGLVSGVIDVASQAYCTAKTVLSNLRPRPDAAENGNGGDSWTRVPERSTSENLEVLLEMGFKNRILNVLLLERYQNDLEKVVAELLLHAKNGRGR